MSAYYDSYDYSSYWNGREYEHESEVICIRAFLNKIKKIDRSIEIGGGYGRLIPSYIYRTKTAVLSEPSSKLLSLAKSKYENFKNIKYVQSTVDNITKKVKPRSFDLALMIRVMHHLDDPDKTFEVIEKLVETDGYFILEFANKIHFKNVVSHVLKGDFNFIKNKEIIDIRSEEAKKQKMIKFMNYHPEVIMETLKKHNFEIVEKRSVSNIRSPFLKKHMPKMFLLTIEKWLQIPLSYIYFGPSIFILARKRG